MIATGVDPYPLDVLHDCPGGDNPHCVNPAHLSPGTQSENLRQAYEKGQKPSAKGKRYERRLTPNEEAEIKRLYVPWRVTLDALAEKFGTSKSTISRIINGFFEGAA